MAEIERLARAHDKVRAVGETGLDHYRTGEDGPGRAGRELPAPRRPGQAARQDAGHPRPRRPRRGARGDRQRGCPRAVGDALLLRRRRLRARLPRPRRLPQLRRHRSPSRTPPPLRNALVVAPLDRMLVETDAPYLTPMPYRGRPNASYLVPLTVRAMAERTRGRPGDPVPGPRRQHRAGLRRPLVRRAGARLVRRVPRHKVRTRVWHDPEPPLSFRDCWPGSGQISGQRQGEPPKPHPREPPLADPHHRGVSRVRDALAPEDRKVLRSENRADAQHPCTADQQQSHLPRSLDRRGPRRGRHHLRLQRHEPRRDRLRGRAAA